ALTSQADLAGSRHDVSELPIPAVSRCSKSNLLDHLIGHRRHTSGHLEAECLGGLEVDHKLKLGRLGKYASRGTLRMASSTSFERTPRATMTWSTISRRSLENASVAPPVLAGCAAESIFNCAFDIEVHESCSSIRRRF